MQGHLSTQGNQEVGHWCVDRRQSDWEQHRCDSLRCTLHFDWSLKHVEFLCVVSLMFACLKYHCFFFSSSGLVCRLSYFCYPWPFFFFLPVFFFLTFLKLIWSWWKVEVQLFTNLNHYLCVFFIQNKRPNTGASPEHVTKTLSRCTELKVCLPWQRRLV